MTPPLASERLEKRLARVARELGIDQERLRRWVSFHALCGVLEKALAEGILGAYYVKGGVAMELRFPGQARATKDFDLGMEGIRGTRLALFQNALRGGYSAFTFRVKGQTRDMDLADTIRVEVAVAYRTKAWQTIDVDLGPGPPTGNPAAIDLVVPNVRGLTELGLNMSSPIRCLALPEQVAQKLHACTAPNASSRARDILDILLVDRLQLLDHAETGRAARRVFDERGTHDFPPSFQLPDAWREEVERIAVDLGFPVLDADVIAEVFQRLIDRLADQSGRGVRKGRP